MAETPRLQCRGLAFDPWLVNEDPSRLAVQPKKKRKKSKTFHKNFEYKSNLRIC